MPDPKSGDLPLVDAPILRENRELGVLSFEFEVEANLPKPKTRF